MPGLASSPWIRRCPHSGFSLASRTARRAIPGTVGGRPGLRRLLVAYFFATSLRCQASSVQASRRRGMFDEQSSLCLAAGEVNNGVQRGGYVGLLRLVHFGLWGGRPRDRCVAWQARGAAGPGGRL